MSITVKSCEEHPFECHLRSCGSQTMFIVQRCVIVFGDFVPNAGVELDDVIFAIASDVG